LLLSSLGQCCQMCYFSAIFGYFFFVRRVKLAFGGWRIFWLFSQYFGGKFGGFLYKIWTSVVSWKIVKIHLILCRLLPPNLFFQLCSLYIPVPAVSVQWKPCIWLGFRIHLDARHLTGRCGRRVLDCIGSTYSEKRSGKS